MAETESKTKEIHKLQDEIRLWKRNFIKYGAHRYCFDKDKCTCGFDEIKEQALAVIIEEQRMLFESQL